jgi:hypothetical protein
MVHRIQIALDDRSQAERLRELLLRTCSLRAEVVDEPDPSEDGVIVTSVQHLRRQAGGVRRPERFVIISPHREEDLEVAWNAGIRIVLYDTDPMNSIVLAVMSSMLATRPQIGHGAARGAVVG